MLRYVGVEEREDGGNNNDDGGGGGSGNAVIYSHRLHDVQMSIWQIDWITALI